MARMLFKLWIAIALCLSANGLSNLPATLSETLPSLNLNTCVLDLNFVLSLFTANTCTSCQDLCTGLAKATEFVTDLPNPNSNVPPETLIDFHCVRAGGTVDEIFSWDPNAPNIFEQFQLTQDPAVTEFGIFTHGFLDGWPGKLDVHGIAYHKYLITQWAANGINVCACNYGPLSVEFFNYFVVSQYHAPIVAKVLSDTISKLVAAGINQLNIQLVGHSLGAQISGQAGARARSNNQKIGKIFALDPAGPCFTAPCKVPIDNRISPDDAVVVQLIHTEIFILGQAPKDGKQDFYLNLGIITPPYDPIFGSHVFALWIFIWTCNPDNICQTNAGDNGVASQRLGIHYNDPNEVPGGYHIWTYVTNPNCPFDFTEFPIVFNNELIN